MDKPRHLVRLETAAREYVISALLPAFVTPPAVVQWGDRTFLLAERPGSGSSDATYRECFAVAAVETRDTTDAEQRAPAGPAQGADRLEALVAPSAVLRALLVDELGGKIRTPTAAIRAVSDWLEHLARTKWAEGQSRSDAHREAALHVGQADYRSAALLRHLADLLDRNVRPAGTVLPEPTAAQVPTDSLPALPPVVTPLPERADALAVLFDLGECWRGGGTPAHAHLPLPKKPLDRDTLAFCGQALHTALFSLVAEAAQEKVTGTSITLTLDPTAIAYLECLLGSTGHTTVLEVLEHLVHSAVDGIRRPGAWERGWVTQAFGNAWASTLRRDPEVHWQMLPPLREGEPQPGAAPGEREGGAR